MVVVGCSSQKKRNEEAKCCIVKIGDAGGNGLVSETVKGPSLPLEGVNDVEGGNGLSLWKNIWEARSDVKRWSEWNRCKDSLACSV
jgi:hypothetical protein